MEIKALSGEKTYIDLNLYIISQNKNIKKQYIGFKKSFLLIITLLLFLLFLLTKHWVGAVLLLVIVFISWSYPYFAMKFLYSNLKKQYKMSGHSGMNCTFATNSENLVWSNGKIDFKTKLRDIKRIVEVGEYFFLDLDMNISLAFEKSDVDAIRTELRSYSAEYNIPYLTKLDWDNNIFSKNNNIII